MQQRPIIGITTTNLKALSGIPAGVPDSWVMSQRFILAPTAVGGVPWLIPLIESEADLRAIYDRLDGILFPGGADIEPGTYGAARHEACQGTDPARDRVELKLLGWALEDGKPLLGICRGIQLINLARGGTLYQDLAAELPEAEKHDYFPDQGYARDQLTHDIEVAAGTRLAELLGTRRLRVNSMHHQALRAVGRDLVVSARSAADGVIEAIEVPDHPFMIGVQWHPEALSDRDAVQRRLFTAFIEAAAGRASAVS
jgi:putative glutamine amidotransferase